MEGQAGGEERVEELILSLTCWPHLS
jgi:hypothetical protein